ncbi:hypothetical protein ABPG77_002171 [Micractinium sp. CCAP 211/92]
MAKLTAFLAAALLLASGACALDLMTFLTDPKFAPFVQVASQTSCITDPAVTGSPPAFDLDLCPSLLSVLDALNQGQADIALPTCEKACSDTFYKLSDQCLSELTAAFKNNPSSPISQLGVPFLEQCAEVHNNPDMGGGAPASAPSPAMGPGMAPAPAPAA